MKSLVCFFLALTVLVSLPLATLADTKGSENDLTIEPADGSLSGAALQAQGPVFARWKLPKGKRRNIPVHIYASQTWAGILEESFRPWDAMLSTVTFTYFVHAPVSACPSRKGHITVCTVFSLPDEIYGETYTGLQVSKRAKRNKGEKDQPGLYIVRAQIRVSIAAHRDGQFLDRVEALNTGCHEMGHALGGNHRRGNPNASCINNASNRASPGWQDHQAFKPLYKRSKRR